MNILNILPFFAYKVVSDKHLIRLMPQQRDGAVLCIACARYTKLQINLPTNLIRYGLFLWGGGGWNHKDLMGLGRQFNFDRNTVY